MANFKENIAARPLNQIEQLQKEAVALKELVEDQKAELLQLYRRIHQYDSPKYLTNEPEKDYR